MNKFLSSSFMAISIKDFLKSIRKPILDKKSSLNGKTKFDEATILELTTQDSSTSDQSMDEIQNDL